MDQIKRTPATPLQFGVGYGFIVTANNDGSIPLNSKALAKIEPGGEEAILEMQRRANAYPKLVEALRGVMGLVQLLAHAHDDTATKNHRYVDATALLRSLGEDA